MDFEAMDLTIGREVKRPESPPFPNVWRRFKGQRPMPDGRIADFWVQDATEDMADEVADHFLEHFARDEEMSKSLGAVERRVSEEHRMGARFMARAVLGKRITPAAFTDWPDGKPHLVGFNLLYVFGKGDAMPPHPDEKVRKMQSVMFLTLGMVDVYAKYGVEEFTTAIGLSVAPQYRGQGVGVELLKARVQITKAVGLRLTLNNFTGVASQKQAARAGFELLADVPYDEIKNDDGTAMFPGTGAKRLQFRARYVDDATTDEDLK